MSQRFLKLGWRSVAFKCTYPIPNIKHLRKPWFDMGFTDIQTLFLVARIYTTTQPCVFDINVSKRLTFCHFSNQQFRNETTKSLQRLFFHLASARYVSLGHVVAIDPLIDCIPESGIDCWASAVFHLTGAFFFEMLPTTINLLGSCNFLSSPHSHLPSPFTTHVDHGLHHHAFGNIPST